jgi:hypothetical protein
MIASYGFTDHPPRSTGARTRLSFRDGALRLTWQHCSLTAEFLGEFFAVQARQRLLDDNEARHNIAYLTNELLENVIKFRAAGPIDLETAIEDGTFSLKVSNRIAPETATKFQATLTALLARDPGELLIERIEANAAEPLGSGSGLGLLTLMNDYGAKLGWTFRQDTPGEPFFLHTYASLALT